MFESFRTRSQRLERIDTGDHTAEEYSLWQREMVFIHRWFGESRAIRRTLFPKLSANASVLDVGAGSGELLNTIRESKIGSAAFLYGADIEPRAARTILERGFKSIVCSGTDLPFGDDTFDHAVSSLVFHHLSDETAAKILREMLRVSRNEIFVFDLRRSALAYLGYRSISYFVFQKLTREDGALSILRSFTDDELRKIGERAGLLDIHISRSAFFRLILSGRK